MKTTNLLLFYILMIVSAKAGAPQASWHFTIWFNIYDSRDRVFTADDFRTDKIKLLTSAHGAFHTRSFDYDNLNNCFRFSQSTITTNGVLAFAYGSDTTTLQISTTDMYLPKIKTI